MWTARELGQAVWHDHGSQWHVDVRGGLDGVRFEPFLALAPVDDDRMPEAAEQYVRGHRLLVNFPQADRSYALRLAIEPIESQPDRLVLEVTISIQTDLLDAHPMLDIVAACDRFESRSPDDWRPATSGAPPICLARSGQHCVSVLLGPHDGPFTTNLSTDSWLQLRLFGEFLEKGVIRKARPWIVIDRTGNAASAAQHEAWWQRLCGSPLPLTP
jgi:hypothetical protein